MIPTINRLMPYQQFQELSVQFLVSSSTQTFIATYDVDLIIQQPPPFRGVAKAFQLRYSSRQYQSADGISRADIQVRASVLDGSLLGETPIIFNTLDEVTDIRLELRPVENPLSEFEPLVASW